eukprot:TCONS_00055493-protein
MVHTRHSFLKDTEEHPLENGKLSGQDEEEEEEVADEEEQRRENDIDLDATGLGTENNKHQTGDIKDEGEEVMEEDGQEKQEEEQESPVKKSKRKRRNSSELLHSYDTLTDTLQRRSMRTRSRDKSRYMDRYEKTRFRQRSSKIRRSGRQRKKVFETFNESEIQREIERKRQQLIEDAASMYDSIKRRRIHSETQDEEDDSDEEGESGDSDEEEEEEEEEHPAYNLRKEKQQTKRYQPPLPTSRSRRREVMFEMHSPMRQPHKMKRIPQHASSPHHKRRRRTSSTSSSSDDEAAFERRKAKSMNQARSRCLPMNFQSNDMVGVLKNRERARELGAGSSLADVEPMNIDSNTSFEDVGGLDHHIRSLKEMVVFPLLYPEIFQKFSISPPRGVLFYGPPGTGKTLVARALANECTKKGQKVAFFMRKGADCLSKWVGESERQLRLLFDQAYTMRPSIIFFDEIDGIAPVRSTRQDQIHSSIVSTLLALMDGLDARGEIVVIGATNRLDSIDPALRRPGRFDREFLFGLPNRKARQKIIEINTSSWQPKLSKEFTLQLADKCVGYCGADIKALCTEAALFALRRRYPQIYKTSKKLALNTNEIKISSVDFKNALKSITPASNRSNISPGVSLPEHLKPLLSAYVEKATDIVMKIFPAGKKITEYDPEEEFDLSDSESQSIYEKPKSRHRDTSSNDQQEFFKDQQDLVEQNLTHRPRILLAGTNGNGQTAYIAPSLLYAMEHLSTHMIDLPALFGTSTRTPEEAVAQLFREARRTAPSILYLPHLESWWSSINDTTRASFMTLLYDLPSHVPVLLVSTCDSPYETLSEELQDLFSTSHNEVLMVSSPTDEQRNEFFQDIIMKQALKKPVEQNKRVKRTLEELPEVETVKERELSQEEVNKLMEVEENILRELRLYLRGVTWKLLADRKYKEFSKPVDPDEVDDYFQVITTPMDLSTVMTRINAHHYNSCTHYLQDIDLITNNCLEYNPDRDQFDKQLRNRACELRDVAYQLVHNDLDPDFEKQCVEIYERRKNAKPGHYGQFAPSFLKVLPKNSTPAASKTQTTNEISNEAAKPIALMPDPSGSRFSRRVRGMNDGVLYDPSVLELVDCRRKSAVKASRTSESENKSPNKTEGELTTEAEDSQEESQEDKENRMEDHNKEVQVMETNDENVDGEDSVNRVKRSLEFDKGGKSENEEATSLLQELVSNTSSCNVKDLERMYSSLCRCLNEHKNETERHLVIKELRCVLENLA